MPGPTKLITEPAKIDREYEAKPEVVREFRSPRMTEEEMQELYLRRSQDPEQLKIARLALAFRYGEDRRLRGIDLEDFITQHLSPVEIVQFGHEVMWKGPAPGLDTLVQRMSKANNFKPMVLADHAPTSVGIMNQTPGVSRIAQALRIGEIERGAAEAGLPGDMTLGDAEYALSEPPEPPEPVTEGDPVPVPTKGHWYSGSALHIVRPGLSAYGRPMTIDFIFDSDYDPEDVLMLTDLIDNELLPNMKSPHDAPDMAKRMMMDLIASFVFGVLFALASVAAIWMVRQ